MAGGGIKINNIKVSGGADGKTPVFNIEDGYLFNSYDNGKTWHKLGKVKGEDGVDGEDGATGAKLVSQVLVGQDASGGNIYKQTFDDGTTAIFVAPKGEQGEQGEAGKDHSEEIAQLNEKLETYFIEAKEQIDINSEEISENSAKIHNLTGALLEGGVLETVEVEQAYSVRQTADGEDIVDYNGEGQFTFPEKITGATIKSPNIIKYPYPETTKTVEGLTFKDNGDGTISLTGTRTSANENISFSLGSVTLQAGTYTFSGVQKGYDIAFSYVDEAGNYASILGSTSTYAVKTFDKAVNLNLLVDINDITEGETVNFVVKPMLNPGDVAQPFSPNFAGLKNSYFKGIKSTGKNLISYPYSQVSINNPFNSGGITFTENSDGSISVVGTATGIAYCKLSNVNLVAGTKYTLSAGAGSANAFVYVQRPISGETYSANSGTIIFTAKNTGSYEVYITVKKGITVNMTIYPMLNVGETALPYEPYKADESFMLDEAVKLCKWDSFNPQTGELVRQTETITLDGSKAWITNGEDGTVSGWYSKPEHWTAYNSNTDNKFVSSKLINGSKSAYNFHNLFPIGTTLEEVQAYYDGIVVAGKLKTPTTETIANAPKKYQAWNGGSETLVQGDTDNSTFGAMPTVGQEYFIKVGGVTDEQTE